MIVQDPSSLIKRVGYNRLDTSGFFNETIKPPTKLKAESVVDLVSTLRRYTGLTKYHIYPNYQFHYLGCSGFVAEIDTTTRFSSDLFASWLYRCHFMCEVIVTDEKTFLADLPKKIPLVRAAIPDDPLVSMNFESTEYTGWSPALGRYGNLIYLGTTRDRNASKDVNRNRYFICGRSGIHDNYVNALLDLDYAKGVTNLNSNSSINEPFSQATIGEQFSDSSTNPIMSRAISLAKENCRRLVTAFASALGVIPCDSVREIVQDDEEGEYSVYDVPPKTTSPQRDPKYLVAAKDLWPKEVRITPYSVLHVPNNEKLDGYQIGAVLLQRSIE